MKVPLIGICSPNTVNLETGNLQSIMWRNGKKESHVVPYKPYCYVPDAETGKLAPSAEVNGLILFFFTMLKSPKKSNTIFIRHITYCFVQKLIYQKQYMR